MELLNIYLNPSHIFEYFINQLYLCKVFHLKY